MSILQQVENLKLEQNAVVAAHTYQSPGVQDLADIIGDSFTLAKKAAESSASVVYICGVRFMAEGVKILSPNKRVVLVEPTADCPMARQIDPQRVKDFRAEHPDAAVVAYINTTAELKAAVDVCVTSSSAVKIVRALPQKDILFIPDKNLGSYVQAKVPEKNIITWEGYCPIHQSVTPSDIVKAKAQYPNATVAVHPECIPGSVKLADMVGSTAAIIDYINSTKGEIIVVTERGVVDRLSRKYPDRLHQLCVDKLTCPDMKRTTADILLAAMQGHGGEEINMDPHLMDAARASLIKMIQLGG